MFVSCFAGSLILLPLAGCALFIYAEKKIITCGSELGVTFADERDVGLRLAISTICRVQAQAQSLSFKADTYVTVACHAPQFWLRPLCLHAFPITTWPVAHGSTVAAGIGFSAKPRSSAVRG